jgi:uncharacterized membrane protein
VSDSFRVLVLLHVLCVIGGFGALAYNALYASLAARRSGPGAGAVLEVNTLVSGLAELLLYAAFLFGVGAVGASHKTIKFGDAWVAAAMGVFLADIAILHAFIRPQRKAYEVVVRAAESGSVDRAALRRLERRVGLGWAVFNVLVIGAVYLMVFQPT